MIPKPRTPPGPPLPTTPIKAGIDWHSSDFVKPETIMGSLKFPGGFNYRNL